MPFALWALASSACGVDVATDQGSTSSPEPTSPPSGSGPETGAKPQPAAVPESGADGNAVALWLFDDARYPHTTLTDATENEYDLLLMKGAELVDGKFGGALRRRSSDYAVSYASWQGNMVSEKMKADNGDPSGHWGPTAEPRKVLDALASPSWTIELWARLAKVDGDVFLLDLGDALLPGFSMRLAAGGKSLVVKNDYAGAEITFGVNAPIPDDRWHHLAVSHREVGATFFVDGQPQGAPERGTIAVQALPPDSRPKDLANETRGFSEKSPDDWRRARRFNLALAGNREKKGGFDGAIDEIRVSDVARYVAAFAPPTSFARNYATAPRKAAVASGPPLLFANGKSLPNPVPLESRKHVFIDEILVDTKSNLELKTNPVTAREDLQLVTDAGTAAFRPPKGGWRETVFENEGKVYFFVSDGYSSGDGLAYLWESTDGVNFAAPKYGLFEYKGSKDNNLIFHRRPLGSIIFKDSNPATPPEEQFKVTGWAPNRGTYLYTSGDLKHWRRNETSMLPLASGGDAESYWDDQRGLYVTHLKRDASAGGVTLDPMRGRAGVRFETAEPFKPWPFKALDKPYFEGWSIPTLSEEGVIDFPIEPIVPYVKAQEIYRTRATKYPWAPDVYVAFYWVGFRNALDEDDPDTKRFRTRLAVSRDGTSWTRFTEEFYMPTVGKIDAVDVRSIMATYGLVRRDAEIWHYAELTTENDGNGLKQYARIKQRLDGFLSLDAGSDTGVVTTKPLTFVGSHLELNVKVSGRARVALLDANGQAYPGHSLADCPPFTADSVKHTVAWTGGTDVSALAGKVVRVQVEMTNAKLYALQFLP